MLKVVQMPRRTQPRDRVTIAHRSMVLPDVAEESESLAKMQRWLDLADSVLENKTTSEKKRPA